MAQRDQPHRSKRGQRSGGARLVSKQPEVQPRPGLCPHEDDTVLVSVDDGGTFLVFGSLPGQELTPLTEALGGPTTYSDTCGDETSVVRIHSGNGRHEEMDRRAIACFDQALADVGLASDDRLRQVLYDHFAWATTTTMSRYHQSADDVPDGLRIPHWSWDGAVSGDGS